MALDADGGVHILCAVRDNTSTDIVYWNNTNGTWASESVAQVDTDGSKNIDMDVDGEGKVHAVVGFEGNEGENITYHYVSNANGGWEFVPIYSPVNWMEALPLPDIEIDSEGRPHIAYVAIEGLVEGNDSSGDWFIRLITRDNEEWTDVRNISLPGLCMSLSLQLDDDGYEHLLYWCVVPSASLTQPVTLATWNASGLSWVGIADGTGQCELHLDRDGTERFIFMREGGYCFVGADGIGNIDRSVRYPAGTYPASRDIGDMTDNGTLILLFDSMCEELLLYMPGSVSIYPEFSNIESSDEEVRLKWDPMVPGDPSIEGIRVYRKAVWGEEAPIAIDNVSLFSYPVGATGMTDALTADIPTWALMSYRISVITDEGEYIGEMENVYFGGGWEGGMVTRGFWIMVAVIVIASVSFIAILWLLIRKR